VTRPSLATGMRSADRGGIESRSASSHRLRAKERRTRKGGRKGRPPDLDLRIANPRTGSVELQWKEPMPNTARVYTTSPF